MDPSRVLAERIRNGRSTVVVGEMPPLPQGIVALRIGCDPIGTRGVLDRARASIEAALEYGSTRELSRERRELSAHRRLLAEREGWRRSDVAFVEACNLLAARSGGRIVLVLDGIEDADAETHRALARILREPGRLRLPLVLLTRAAPRGSFLEVVEAMDDRKTEHRAVVTSAPESVPASEEPAPASSESPPKGEGLPEDVLRVLRAAAVVGATFDVANVARLLDVSADVVLEQLQRARDLGIPVVDRGNGRFVLPEALAGELRESMLPSLRDRWHARLGELLAREDPLRAAKASEAVGRVPQSLEQRLDAAAAMIDAGDVGRAARTLEEMGDSIGRVPSLEARTMLEARMLVEKARLAWLTTSDEGAASLEEAWTLALSARRRLPSKGHAHLRAYIAATLAAIAYDVGEGPTLEQARDELIDTIGALLQEGATLDAASLLNEQAALELRRGRLGPAAELLVRSHRLFEAQVQERAGDGAARAELADTDLLIARLPLHASPSSIDDVAFVSNESIATSLEHARAAEKAYRSLRLRRELARACDVLGRLESRRGDRVRARQYFEEAIAIGEELGDAATLARSTAALAEVLAQAGQPEQALGLLRSSIGVNREKGSTLGLSYDAATLEIIERVVARMGGAVETALRPELLRARAGLDDGTGPVTARP